ncbi:MAG: DMT family transporter [Granulosicoccaceae bacterium]
MVSPSRWQSGLLDFPYLLLVLTTLFWGGNAVAGKFAVGQIDPLLLTFFRWLFGALCFAWLAKSHITRDWPVLRQHLWVLLGLGMVGFTLFNLLLYSGLQYTSAINVTIEQASIPLLILLLNRCFFAQAIVKAQWLALVLATVGVVITVSRGDPVSLLQGQLNRGDGMMVLACVCYAAYSVGLRYKPDVHWSGVMLLMACGALLLCSPVVVYQFFNNGLYAPTPTGWVVVVYAVVFPTVCAQLFYLRAVSLIGSNRAGLFINLVPVFAAVLAVLLLAERLHFYHLVGFSLVLGGIALSERTSRSE